MHHDSRQYDTVFATGLESEGGWRDYQQTGRSLGLGINQHTAQQGSLHLCQITIITTVQNKIAENYFKIIIKIVSICNHYIVLSIKLSACTKVINNIVLKASIKYMSEGLQETQIIVFVQSNTHYSYAKQQSGASSIICTVVLSSNNDSCLVVPSSNNDICPKQ